MSRLSWSNYLQLKETSIDMLLTFQSIVNRVDALETH